jgi:hypothetical protein
MGRIPLPATGNPKLDRTLKLIDEQLSELYSQHGTFDARSRVGSRGSSGSISAGGTSNSWVNVEGASVAITGHGSPVAIFYQGDPSSSTTAYISVNKAASSFTTGLFRTTRNGAIVAHGRVQVVTAGLTAINVNLPPSILNCVDFRAPAGNLVYQLQYCARDAGDNASVHYTNMFALELAYTK